MSRGATFQEEGERNFAPPILALVNGKELSLG